MLDDICSNKHQGSQLSLDSYRAKVKPTASKLRGMIADFIKSRGGHGATSHEICDHLCLKLQTVSARCSELKRDRIVVMNGARRGNAAVLIFNGS